MTFEPLNGGLDRLARRMIPTRRALLGAFGRSLLLSPLAAIERFGRSQAAEGSWRHGVSLFGKLKYPAHFAHFDYVNPRTPKLGDCTARCLRHLR